MKKSLFVVVSLLMVVCMLFGCAKTVEPAAEAPAAEEPAAEEPAAEEPAAEEPAAEEPAAEKWKIALTNTFMGNDWRQNMCAIAEMVAADPYYADRLTLDIIQSEHTPEAQTQIIDNCVEQGYDAILVDACSTTGIDQAMIRAEEAGVTIVVFDQVVDTDRFVKMETDWALVATDCAKFIAAACNGEGNYVLDIGLNGAATAVLMSKVFDDYMAANTSMKKVAEFEGEYAEGPAEQGVSNAMTANPQIDAVFSQGYINCISRAFRNAGKEIPVITGGGANGTGIDVLEYGDYTVFQWFVNLSGLGAMALEQAVQMLEGNMPAEKHIVLGGVYLTNDMAVAEAAGLDCQEYKEGVNAFPDKLAAYEYVVLPEDFPVQIDMAELEARQANFT